MAVNAEELQVTTGPQASFVHHAAAWAQGQFDISAVASLGVVFGGMLVALCILIGTYLALAEDDGPMQ